MPLSVSTIYKGDGKSLPDADPRTPGGLETGEIGPDGVNRGPDRVVQNTDATKLLGNGRRPAF